MDEGRFLKNRSTCRYWGFDSSRFRIKNKKVSKIFGSMNYLYYLCIEIKKQWGGSSEAEHLTVNQEVEIS